MHRDYCLKGVRLSRHIPFVKEVHVMRNRRMVATAVLTLLSLATATPQDVPSEGEVPVSTRWTLDAAGAMQRNSIHAVFLMICPATQRKGTGFLIDSGLIVTNEHVVRGCEASNIRANAPTGRTITFRAMTVDVDRDLAALTPIQKLAGGFALGSDETLKLGNVLTTWGYPLIYNGPSPILSVGYLAGFNAVPLKPSSAGRVVKHLVVNGAFNPGNSGGPVFNSNDNKVIGVVVWKQRILSQLVPTVINGLKNPQASASGTFTETLSDGTKRSVSNEEAVSRVLDEFYNTVQIMIGEAISVSELKDFLAPTPSSTSTPRNAPNPK